MKITMTAISESQHARLYKQKVKIITERFIYKKPDTFQKARKFPLRFYIQKAIHFVNPGIPITVKQPLNRSYLD